ncbi:MAG: GNAT family N-acetyltransferase [Candidatus Hodarchaeales archaeon]|jgi:ribosomal protein S18 acetylase RimI-like enzyme
MTKVKIRKSNITYRKANFADISDIIAVFISSVTDYASRMNFPFSTPSESGMERFYSHAMSTGDFYVAITEKKVVGFAGSTIRDNIWFLSAFWVEPSYQRSGIGFPLLEYVYNDGIDQGASIFFVYSSTDFPAIISYMKFGMYPGYPVFSFEGTLKNSIDLSDFNNYESTDLQEETTRILDLEIRGVNRYVDHEYWKSNNSKPFQIEKKGEIIGYYYINNGFIGPLVSKKKEEIEPLLYYALNDAMNSNQNKIVNVMVPGINHTVLKILLSSGLRIKTSAHFLTSKQFGKLENYLPSGAGLY